MERLEADLRFFRQQLAQERDPFLRNLLLGQIRGVEQDIYNLLHQERLELERQNRNLQEMLEFAKKIKKKGNFLSLAANRSFLNRISQAFSLLQPSASHY